MTPMSDFDGVALLRDQLRQVDRTAVDELGIPGLLLMENAARGVVEVLSAVRKNGKIVILCGPGNNGGDGLAVARLLSAINIPSEVWLISAGKNLSHDAAANLSFLQKAGIAVSQAPDIRLTSVLSSLDDSDWIVDAMLGTGTQGIARSPFSEVIFEANRSKAARLAVDVPSGMDCDTGQAAGPCIHAEMTVTFVARKKGFDNPQSQQFTGRVVVKPIGIPGSWLNQRILRESSAGR